MKHIKGFTLIEIVIVIAILGILAGLAIPRFVDATEAARGAKLLGDMRTIESMALVYATDHGGRYPKVTTTNTGFKFEDGSEKFNDYFLDGYPLPPQGIISFQGSDGNTYRYDLSDRQYYYGYNGQKRNGVDFQFATCDGKSIYEFLTGKTGNNGKGPISVSSNNGISIDIANELATNVSQSITDAINSGNIKNFGQGNIDSEAKGEGTRTAIINAYLKNHGFNLDKYSWSIRGTDTSDYTLYVYPKLTAAGFTQATVYQVTNGVIGTGQTKTVEVIFKDGILRLP
ncbi:type II secretion system protein [Phascolarctobacterium sp.]